MLVLFLLAPVISIHVGLFSVDSNGELLARLRSSVLEIREMFIPHSKGDSFTEAASRVIEDLILLPHDSPVECERTEMVEKLAEEYSQLDLESIAVHNRVWRVQNALNVARSNLLVCFPRDRKNMFRLYYECNTTVVALNALMTSPYREYNRTGFDIEKLISQAAQLAAQFKVISKTLVDARNVINDLWIYLMKLWDHIETSRDAASLCMRIVSVVTEYGRGEMIQMLQLYTWQRLLTMAEDFCAILNI